MFSVTKCEVILDYLNRDFTFLRNLLFDTSKHELGKRNINIANVNQVIIHGMSFHVIH